MHEDLGQAREAEALYRESLALVRGALPPESPDLAYPLFSLGTLLDEAQRFAEAEALLREALALRRSALPADHPLTAQTARALTEVQSR